MRGQCHAPAALYPRERLGTHYIGGWVGPRAGLDRCGKSRPPPWDSTELPGQLICHIRSSIFIGVVTLRMLGKTVPATLSRRSVLSFLVHLHFLCPTDFGNSSVLYFYKRFCRIHDNNFIDPIYFELIFPLYTYSIGGSLPHSQVPATCPYPETDRSSPCSHIPLPEDPS